MSRYTDLKKAIIKDGRFLRKHKDEDNELLTRWFWAGVAAVVQVESSNAVLADVRALKREIDEGLQYTESEIFDDGYNTAIDDVLKKISEHFS